MRDVLGTAAQATISNRCRPTSTAHSERKTRAYCEILPALTNSISTMVGHEIMRLANGTYAKIEILSAQGGTVHVLCYLQPDGSRELSTTTP